jgi:hypothetical protein
VLAWNTKNGHRKHLFVFVSFLCPLSKLARAVALLTLIQKVALSNLNRDNGYPD